LTLAQREKPDFRAPVWYLHLAWSKLGQSQPAARSLRLPRRGARVGLTPGGAAHLALATAAKALHVDRRIERDAAKPAVYTAPRLILCPVGPFRCLRESTRHGLHAVVSVRAAEGEGADSLLGKRVRCPRCKTVYQAEAPAEALDDVEVLDEPPRRVGRARRRMTITTTARPADAEERLRGRG